MSSVDNPQQTQERKPKKKRVNNRLEQREQVVVVQELSEQQKLRQAQAKKQKRQEEMQKLKNKYLPLLKFLKKNGLVFKSAAVKKHTVEYFRMDHFKSFLLYRKDKIQANASISKLLQNWEKIFLYYQRIQGQVNFKWPEELERSTSGPDSKFASFKFQDTGSSKWVTVAMVLGMIAVVLFPLWPFELKYAMWIFSLYSAILIVATMAVRLLVYLLGAVFGGSLWIFPRLLQNCGFVQSVVPIFSWSWWEGSTLYSSITRVAVLLIFIYYGVHIYNDPSIIQENLSITKTIVDDINGWAVAKMKGERNFSQSALTDYSQLYNSTVDDDEGSDIQALNQLNDEV